MQNSVLPTWQIDDPCGFNQELCRIELLEHIVSSVIGGVSVKAESMSPQATRWSEEAGKLWLISQGEVDLAIDIFPLFPCNAPLMRARAYFEMGRIMKKMQEDGIWPEGELDVGRNIVGEDSAGAESGNNDGWREYKVSAPANTVSTTVRIKAPIDTTAFERIVARSVARKSVIERSQIRVALPMALTLMPNETLDLTRLSPMSVLIVEPLRCVIEGIEGNVSCHAHEGGCMIVKEEKNSDEANIVGRRESIESAHHEALTSGSEEREREGSEPLGVTISLGTVSLTLSQIARLRQGMQITVASEQIGGDGNFPCALTIGSTGIARGELRFVANKVVLTISDIA